MKKNKTKKILNIILITILVLIFIASLTFGSIAAFATSISEEIEVWYVSKYEEEISLLNTSIKWLIISSVLLTVTLSFKDLKNKYID